MTANNPSSTGIVERLRALQPLSYGPVGLHALIGNAADEIDRLRLYVDAFRREEARADNLGRELDDLRSVAQGQSGCGDKTTIATEDGAFESTPVTVTIFARGDGENTPAEAVHHALAYAHKAGFIEGWSDPIPSVAYAARIKELERRVTEHEQLQARIAQALGRETWQGDLAVAVEAEVARANGNGESCKEFCNRLSDVVTALDHGLSQRAKEIADLALKMPWAWDASSVPSTDREGGK